MWDRIRPLSTKASPQAVKLGQSLGRNRLTLARVLSDSSHIEQSRPPSRPAPRAVLSGPRVVRLAGAPAEPLGALHGLRHRRRHRRRRRQLRCAAPRPGPRRYGARADAARTGDGRRARAGGALRAGGHGAHGARHALRSGAAKRAGGGRALLAWRASHARRARGARGARVCMAHA